MARTSFSVATHAVVGLSVDGARGVLFWHDNEFDAHREAKQVRAGGGTCKVFPAPGGDLGDGPESYVKSLVMGA